jgi:hypothetical protein
MKRLALAAAGAALAGLTACGHAAVPSAAPAPHPAGAAAPSADRASQPAGQPAGHHASPLNDDEGASLPDRLPAQRAASQPATASAPVPAKCRAQYGSWLQGPGKGLVAALSAVGVADAAGNTQQVRAALDNARPAVARAARYPMPACADPGGYWMVLLMHVNAAATGTGSPSGVRTAMNGVPDITQELMAELKRAGG